MSPAGGGAVDPANSWEHSYDPVTKVFHFSSRHLLPGSADAFFDELHDIEAWPSWWPQVRSVEPIDDRSGYVTIRSFLPITLRLRLVALVDDAATRTLRASLDGDLTGWSQFVVEPDGAGSLLRYDQEARVTKPGAASTFAGAARPLLVANHRSMMRTGLRALVRRAG